LTLVPFFKRLPGAGVSESTRFFFLLDETLYVTVPTRQCAFLILVFALGSSRPTTFGTTHFGGT
jgi:hypothetical protein